MHVPGRVDPQTFFKSFVKLLKIIYALFMSAKTMHNPFDPIEYNST